MNYRRVASLKTSQDFFDYLESLDVTLPFDEEVASGPASPLAQPLRIGERTIGNRFCILPMEGWDGTPDGRVTELVERRWVHFGISGAKLLWGGEAVAVRYDGRANPNQLVSTDQTTEELARLREKMVDEHRTRFSTADDLLVGLQLTHSGRFARPNRKETLEPTIVYHHPILDRRVGIDVDYPVLADDEIRRLVEDFVRAAKRAAGAGFDFVDIKHCHGYLGHEFLSGYDRPGPFGGSFENRTRFLREIVEGIRSESPGLLLGVRLSAADMLPFKKGADVVGIPEEGDETYRYAFGGDGSGLAFDLAEPIRFLDLLKELDIPLVCISVGSPYYNPHIQRPALFPPSDGYLPPEDPLVGVARQIDVTAKLKQHAPELIVVGSGYTYLQDWLPNVAQSVVRQGMADSIGLGRMVLSYPDLPADVIEGRRLSRKRICRTFSDCTTGPRNGLISGCYPLDPFYKSRPEAKELAQIKQAWTGEQQGR
ncbi:NADPH dehydrogenase [Planctomycetes bacterium Pan216]|uniref:NADPH dehydrogenase n=1 Tax=Kolteria novifilia TaxID=2527975 RepID=A0A518BC66_9BACT|nr:NADPH dehydrogenase [Planctomycetes bacterium Pan216]